VFQKQYMSSMNLNGFDLSIAQYHYDE
jgi:hypothetical protein